MPKMYCKVEVHYMNRKWHIVVIINCEHMPLLASDTKNMDRTYGGRAMISNVFK